MRPPTDAARELVASYTRVGDMLAATGERDRRARAAAHRARRSWRRLAAAAADDLDNMRQLGVAYQKLGNSLGNPN